MELTIEQMPGLLEKATPGPWGSRPQHGTVFSSDGRIAGVTLAQIFAGSRALASLEPTDTNEEASANAALIAAAPDLARLALALHAQLQQERAALARQEGEAFKKEHGFVNGVCLLCDQSPHDPGYTLICPGNAEKERAINLLKQPAKRPVADIETEIDFWGWEADGSRP